jgi:hypothetical protein
MDGFRRLACTTSARRDKTKITRVNYSPFVRRFANSAFQDIPRNPCEAAAIESMQQFAEAPALPVIGTRSPFSLSIRWETKLAQVSKREKATTQRGMRITHLSGQLTYGPHHRPEQSKVAERPATPPRCATSRRLQQGRRRLDAMSVLLTRRTFPYPNSRTQGIASLTLS